MLSVITSIQVALCLSKYSFPSHFLSLHSEIWACLAADGSRYYLYYNHCASLRRQFLSALYQDMVTKLNLQLKLEVSLSGIAHHQ